ncbi:prefoldin subunit alpha [Candidatus Micrarchaeota archaeon]|nr:prefoldin subunit alpha [Candidatus Micrarchaeota archaeon]
MATLEEAQGQINYELAVYREQMAMLKRETERISLTTLDLTNALKTVEELGEEKVMMPIGGGAMIRGKITDTMVIIPIGGGYSVEMDKAKATVELNHRIDATKKALEKLNEEFNKIVNRFQELSLQMQQTDAQAKISERGKETMREDYL